jgi:FkbH-like protein
MQHSALALDVNVPGDDLLARASGLILDRGLRGVPDALAVVAGGMEVAVSDEHQVILVQAISAIVEGLAQGVVADAAAALVNCPSHVAVTIYDLLGAAVLGDDPFDSERMSAPFLLCYVLAKAAAGERDEAAALLDREVARRDPAFGEAAEVVDIAIDPFRNFKPKLIIWDLDDTLWRGTLAEGDAIELIEERVALVRAFNAHGIVSAICSKNDGAAARSKLQELGVWDDFVFPRIAFVPKGQAVSQLISHMRLRPKNVLFIDDNLHNLHEVAAASPGIRILDANARDFGAITGKLLDDHSHVIKSRIQEYRALQTKVDERAASPLSNEAFLQASDIRIVFTRLTDNVQFAERIEELINRSNQLNYTETRVAPGSMAEQIMRIEESDTHAVFVWDRYGDYGLVGFAAVNPDTGSSTISFCPAV